MGAMMMLAEVGASSEVVTFFSLAGLTALVSLAALEIVLGIDNIVFIAILTQRLPEEKQARVRNLGLILAGAMRLVLLALAWQIMKLSTPLFQLPFFEENKTDPETGELVRDAATGEILRQAISISGKDLVLLLGGLFLIAKATWEIHHMVEEGGALRHDPETRPGLAAAKKVSVGVVIGQILMLDLVFSLDSVITAVGMTGNYWIMATAVVLAVAVMLTMAGPVSRFVMKRPTMKTLALAFLVLIGVLLVADGLHQHLDRGYIYFAMGFALVVELINMKAGAHRRKKAGVAG